jgi:hypothetical protein
VFRTSALAALAVAAIVAAVNAPSFAAPTLTVSTTMHVSATVPSLCQDFKRPDGTHTTVCNDAHALTAPAGATAIGSPYSGQPDGGAPLIRYSADGSQATVIYF